MKKTIAFLIIIFSFFVGAQNVFGQSANLNTAVLVPAGPTAPFQAFAFENQNSKGGGGVAVPLNPFNINTSSTINEGPTFINYLDIGSFWDPPVPSQGGSDADSGTPADNFVCNGPTFYLCSDGSVVSQGCTDKYPPCVVPCDGGGTYTYCPLSGSEVESTTGGCFPGSYLSAGYNYDPSTKLTVYHPEGLSQRCSDGSVISPSDTCPQACSTACSDPNASNQGQHEPCVCNDGYALNSSGVCVSSCADTSATNYTRPAPCTYVPSVSLSSNTSSVPSVQGGKITLSWKVSNADSCVASFGQYAVTPWSFSYLNCTPDWPGNVAPTNGSKILTPATDADYVLTCSNAYGEASDNVSVYDFCYENPTYETCSPGFCVANPTDPSCAGGAGGTTPTPAPSTPPASGFTLDGPNSAVANFLADLSGSTVPVNLTVDPFGSFGSDVTVNVDSTTCQNVSGYSFDGGSSSPNPSTTMTYSSGYYRSPSGLISLSVVVNFSQNPGSCSVTFKASGGGANTTHTLLINASVANPTFKEI